MADEEVWAFCQTCRSLTWQTDEHRFTDDGKAVWNCQQCKSSVLKAL